MGGEVGPKICVHWAVGGTPGVVFVVGRVGGSPGVVLIGSKGGTPRDVSVWREGAPACRSYLQT